jgi:hypothetical protein
LKVEGSKLKIVERCLKVEGGSNVWGVQCFANLSAIGEQNQTPTYFKQNALPTFRQKYFIAKQKIISKKLND